MSAPNVDLERKTSNAGTDQSAKGESMFHQSKLVSQRPTERPSIYEQQPVLCEREFTTWLTSGRREIPDGPEDTLGDRVSAYDGALLDEFLATLNARIDFWTNVTQTHREDRRTVGMCNIASYIERLKWVSRQSSDPWFVSQPGSRKFTAVAIALKHGILLAMGHMGGTWSQSDCEVAVTASEELESLIYQERGIRFTPPSALNTT
jgi:hypothetical protein